MTRISVTILGSGDAFCAGGRNQASYILSSDETTVLLDCGATALAAMKSAGADPGSVDGILLSHLHGDHFAGLPLLFMEYIYLQQRQRPLRIGGPPGTRERIQALFSAMYRKVASNPLPFPLEVAELLPGQPWNIGPLKACPFSVPHQTEELSFGFEIESGRSSIAYSGDSGWTEELVERSAGTDLFICECSFYKTRLWSHLDYPRIADNRERFQTRRMILTHLGREVVARAADIEIELAYDGLNVTI